MVTETIPSPQEILASEDPEILLSAFQFTVAESDRLILFRFNLWIRKFFPKYLPGEDAPFHKRIDQYNLAVYRGEIKSFTDIAFRGAAKSTRTKLFVAFVIANDREHFRRYFKILSKDVDNATQITTDVYNMFMTPEILRFYPEIFQKTKTKREETMSSFTTSTGIKMRSDSVGTDQRGDLQEEARPDFILFEDIETRKTLKSAVETKTIGDNMEEARTGLSKTGGWVCNANYISERGNVHRMTLKADEKNIVMITPIKNKDGDPMWKIYTIEQINQLEKDAEDFEGEYMCRPSASLDVLFDREKLLNMETLKPVRDIAGFKIFKPYDASHRYAIGADVAGGVGLDSSTSVNWDFSTIPCRVVATFKSNTIKPDTFGFELASQGNRYGGCLVAPEKNNHGHATLAILKQEYDHIFSTQRKDIQNVDVAPPKEYGWHTNAATKPKMMFALKKAVEDGLAELSDPALIAEAKSYSRDDLMDKEADPRLTTRHFDLLIAAAIGWQMKDFAEIKTIIEEPIEDPPMFPEIGI